MNTPNDIIPQIHLHPMTPEEQQRRQKEQQDFERRQHEIKIQNAREGWGAWRRHVECTPEKSGPWGEGLATLEAKLGTGFIISLIGPSGNGKTQMAIELMKTVTSNLKSAAIITGLDFFTEIKDSWRKTSEISESEVVLKYRKPRLLVIDEIGKRVESEWQLAQLFNLLNHRYGDRKDTLIIDNQKKEDFLQALGSSISSRMLETGGIIVADWPSFRKAQG